MLFTRSQVLRVAHFCGKALSGSRNLTVNDFWPVSIIAPVPCNHTLTVCFPLQRAGTWPRRFIETYQNTGFFSVFIRPKEFLSHHLIYQLTRSFFLSCVMTLLDVCVLHTSLHTFYPFFKMGILMLLFWSQAHQKSRCHNSGWLTVWLVTAGCFPPYWNWPRSHVLNVSHTQWVTR